MAKMMNLLMLMLVTLPGATLSFSNTASPWKDLYYRELQLASDQDGSLPPATNTKLENYVCCNNPEPMDMSRRIPPLPNVKFPHHTLLSLVKRAYRDALTREAMMGDAANRRQQLGAPDSSNSASLPSSMTAAGGYPSPLEGQERAKDSLLTGLLGLLKSFSSGGEGGGHRLRGAAALPSNNNNNNNYEGSSAIPGKRRGPDNVVAEKRFGEGGGHNVPWEQQISQQQKRLYGEAGGFNGQWTWPQKRADNGEPGGINVVWTWPPQHANKRDLETLRELLLQLVDRLQYYLENERQQW